MRMVGEFSRYIAYILVDEYGVVMSASKAFLERFSISSDYLLGKPFYEVLGSKELREFFFLNKGKKGEHAPFEALVPIDSCKRGTVWCLAEMIVEHGQKIIYFHDRTESYQAQMVLESVMMLQSDVFVFFDIRKCVLQCSEEAVRIFGFPNRLETFGLHYTTFFHNRVQEGILSELFCTLEQGQRYESAATVRYKGEKKQYEIRAFNVMLKNKKQGMAVCLKETDGSELYIQEEGAYSLYSTRTPYVIQTMEEKFEPYLEMEPEEIKNELYHALCVYDYNECLSMIEYLLSYGENKEKELYIKLRDYLKAFAYDQAAEVMKAYL